jgi:hypothetical protein
LGIELHRTIRTECLCLALLAEDVDLVVWISKRRIAASPTPLFPWLNARADAAVSETAATANKAVTANRTFADRNIVFPTIARPRIFKYSCIRMQSFFVAATTISSNHIDFFEERDASATVRQVRRA